MTEACEEEPERAYMVRRTQTWEFAPGDAADEEHAMTLAIAGDDPDYDEWEVEER